MREYFRSSRSSLVAFLSAAHSLPLVDASIRSSKALLLFFFAVNSVWASPRIACDVTTYDFGTVSDQNTITHEFTIWNRGDTDLTISKVRACCGMKAFMDSMMIAPGTSAICRTVFNLSNRRGEQNKLIYLACDDPKQPYLILKLVGTCQRAIEIIPSTVQFGSLIAGQEKVIELTATNLLQEAVAIDSVSSSVRGVNAEIVQSGERSWKIKVTAMPQADPGGMKGTVQLNFSSGTERIPVYGQVESVITAIPDQITLTAGSTSSVQRLVMLKSTDGQPFEILFVNMLNIEGTVDVRQISDDSWQCSLSIILSSLKPGAHLQVTTSCSSQPEIQIPLAVR